ncbi:hypothetical protein UFOVP46_105 [uncultured Caudovirales phage]|uniref:Uncharacterized protein n=1 Tax=uncultured Caudovirales phage TaxID=2100421 RepID=A0A6J5KS15_9CAUD|nr:hypothetical protein UFOVP46_105 [uncultured Caudovirales phage]
MSVIKLQVTHTETLSPVVVPSEDGYDIDKKLFQEYEEARLWFDEMEERIVKALEEAEYND